MRDRGGTRTRPPKPQKTGAANLGALAGSVGASQPKKPPPPKHVVDRTMVRATQTGRALTPAESQRAATRFGAFAASVIDVGLRHVAQERGTSGSRGHGGAAQILVPGRPQRPQADYPNASFSAPGFQTHSRIGITQSLLENLDLGGIAHPIRRLQHPGGRMEFPGFGKAIPGEAAAAEKLLGRKASRAELEAHPFRQAFHANIDRTVADKQLAAKMKQTFDRQSLAGAKKAGMRPGRFLEHLRGSEPTPVEQARQRLAQVEGTIESALQGIEKDMKARMGGKFDPAETIRRNRAKAQAQGKIGGKRAQARGKLEEQRTQAQELRDDAWTALLKYAERDDNVGRTVKSWLDEHDRLRAVVDQHDEQHLFQEPAATAAESATHLAEPEAQVAGSLGHAGMLRTVQEQGYSHVRSERFGKAQSAFKQAGGGEAGLQAFYGQMAGELPKLGFTDLQHLSGTDELQHLINTVFDHPALTIAQKGRAAKALQNAVYNAVTPTTSEIRDLSKVFPPQDVNKIVHTAEQQQQQMGKLLDVLNIPRSVQASFDVSGLFRQALTVLARHPLVWKEAISPSVRAMKTGEQFDQHYASIVNDADYAPAKAAGVQFTHLGSPLGQEEQYSSRLAEMIPGVSHSARQYTAFLNELRLQLWKKLLPQTEKLALRQAARKGRAPEAALEKAHKDLARYIGSTTGRGPFPKKYAGSAALLNATFFSPRLLSSRFDLLLSPLTYAKASPYVRRQALQTMFHTVGLGIGVLMAASRIPGVTVSMNPTQADFGRIKIGDTRIDIWGGFQPLVRLFAGVAHDVAHRDTSYGAQTAYDRVLTFIRTKYAPNTSFVVDALAGQNVVGQPFRWQDQWQRITPILAQDIVDVLQNRGSIPAAAGAAGLSALGLGVLTYPPHQTAVAGVKERDKWLSDVQKTLGPEWLPESTRRARQNEMLYAQAANTYKTDTYGTTQHALSKRDEATVLLNLAQQVMPAAVDQWGGAAKLGAFVQNASPLQIPHFISFWRKKMWEDRVNYVNKQMAAKRSYQEQKQWNASHGG